jgi:hypothetical protein
VPAHQIYLVRGGGTYCSNECKYAIRRGRERVTGSRYVRPDGYVQIKVGVRRVDLEHRVVMAVAIGRPLATDEHVHHMNGDRADNRLTNLQLLTNAEHQRLHDFGAVRRRRVSLICQQCGNGYEKKASREKESRFCSNACRFESIRRLS